jgi:NADPH2:quinone reductase
VRWRGIVFDAELHTMRAWIIDRFEGIEHMRLADVPDPTPAAGEVVLDTRYAALNPADYYLAHGQYPARPPLPHVLGRDGIGTVSAVGSDVTDFRAGEVGLILRSEIGVSRWGTLAEKVAVPIESLVRPPSDWTEQESAAAPLVYLTAYQALTQWGELKPGVVLVTGASGGVGVATIHLAVAMGHRVIALSRSAEKRAKLIALGAALAFDPQDPEWNKRLKATIAPDRVDLAVDNVGGEQFNRVIDTLGMWGKVSVVGQLAGPVPNFSPASLFFRRLRIGGVAVGTYTPMESQAAWKAIVGMMNGTGKKPIVDAVFPFGKVQDAFARLKQGPMGKVAVEVRPTT